MSTLRKISDLLAKKITLTSPARSPDWDRIRKTHLIINGKCAVCDGIKSLEVHHIKPYHTNPELELDSANLITLCESNNNGINCHLLVGHLGNFRCINADVVLDAMVWKTKLINRME